MQVNIINKTNKSMPDRKEDDVFKNKYRYLIKKKYGYSKNTQLNLKFTREKTRFWDTIRKQFP